ncbi:MAG: sulfatase-like hydrolase/transferase [Planctomycetes bacterium]|nr:sulfatase-like hydrolase/transferase [Planctomycetota bacterium]
MLRHSFVISCAVVVVYTHCAAAADPARPNILWITSEDNGPHLGCYGDKFADTANIDKLAARGSVYLNCWSNAPVCAPARTAIISGMYPQSLGGQHMRSMVRMPGYMKMYPQLLREAGYYCTNNSKEDYNLVKPGKVWDESSKKAHWKNRKPGQPFFAIFNHTVSHESRIRSRPHKQVHDPKKVRVPAYHPDTPEVRQDWAQYYDKLTEMDVLVGKNLKELEEAGLSDDTIVFYYGDHGSGMPRGKRWPFNSGLHVPLIVYIPEKFKDLRPDDYDSGEKTDRLVSFVDLAPTLLSLIGVKPPKYMQGKAFLGEHEAQPRDFIHGFRGRMDERYDMVRSMRDKRFVYIRNYMPHKIYGQFVHYMFQTPTTRVWRELYDAGKLKPPTTYFWETKPSEELYDLESDPDEVHNLAQSPEHQDTLRHLREAQFNHALRIRDLGFFPEGEIHSRSEGSTPYRMGRAIDSKAFVMLITRAALASSGKQLDPDTLKTQMSANSSALRYWAAMGILMRGKEAVEPSKDLLVKALKDESPYVRIVAAEALAKFGDEADLMAALKVLIDSAPVDKNGIYVSMLALNALDQINDKAVSLKDQIGQLPKSAPSVNRRMRSYVRRLIEKTLADLE